MPGEKDRVLRNFDKTIVVNQIKTAEEIIKQSQEQILKLQAQIQQQLGVAAFARHLLEQFELPERKDETVKS